MVARFGPDRAFAAMRSWGYRWDGSSIAPPRLDASEWLPDNRAALESSLQDCTYELYAVTYKEARAAVRAGDAARLEAIRSRVARRTGGSAEACLLALRDAEGKASKRTKFEVCRPICDTRCERGV